MKVPQLRKKPEIKSCHSTTWEDNYSWVHQDNILEVLKDKTKLDPEVEEYLSKENEYTDHHLKDTKELQKKLFDEIKARIKLDDESLPYKDHTYEYWTKTTAEGNYSIKLRKKIGSNNIEEIWNGDKEKEKLGVEYFGVGDLEVSHNDKLLAYSLDTKGSEYYKIFIRDISTNKLVTKEITDTSGGITFSLDDKYIFYSKLDENWAKNLSDSLVRIPKDFESADYWLNKAYKLRDFCNDSNISLRRAAIQFPYLNDVVASVVFLTRATSRQR